MVFAKAKKLTNTLPLVTVREGIVLPNTENVLIFGRSKSTQAINEALRRDKRIVLLMQKNSSLDDPKTTDLYDVGVVVMIKNVVHGDKGEINSLVRGLEKVKILKYVREEPYFEVMVESIEEKITDDEEIRGSIKYISSQVKKAINLGKTIDFIFLMNILNVRSPQDFSYQVGMVLDLREYERQELLEENSIKNRLKKEIDYINREIKILEIEQNISTKTQRKVEQGMKESILREKMKTIEEELGGRSEDKEIDEYRIKIKKAQMPREVEEKATKELKRLAQMSQFNPESSYIKTYLDCLVDLPWSISKSDDVNISKLKLKWLREKIAIVPQEISIFNDTLINNIKYANPKANFEDIVKASKAANAHNFIMSLPKKYKTFVGERGVKLSVGQKQRIALTMAFLKNPRILILDEPTSALDAKSERSVQDGIKLLISGRTTVIIAHRFSTVKNVDKIVVLDKGKIIEVGNHEELMKKKGKYYELYSLQKGLD